MRIFTEPSRLRKWAEKRRMAGAKIALVPTMGALHDGHLSLIAAARRKGATEIVVSVFVNPVQFCPGEDYEKYPRDAKSDAAKCRAAGATALFMPSPDAMYAGDHSVYIDELALGKTLCGARRPGHFRGVCTVVAKLFNIVRPHFAVFGQKDYQQQAIIRRMVRDLDFGVEIVTAPIVREPDGLAMSSRNSYLSAAEREKAPMLHKTLCRLRETARREGTAAWKPLCRRAVAGLTGAGFKVDYLEAVDAATLEPVARLSRGNVVLVAAYCGKTRLIDNMVV